MTKTRWTVVERDEFIAWHESVIAQYPVKLRQELQNDRDKWLAGVAIAVDKQL